MNRKWAHWLPNQIQSKITKLFEIKLIILTALCFDQHHSRTHHGTIQEAEPVEPIEVEGKEAGEW